MITMVRCYHQEERCLEPRAQGVRGLFGQLLALPGLAKTVSWKSQQPQPDQYQASKDTNSSETKVLVISTGRNPRPAEVPAMDI